MSQNPRWRPGSLAAAIGTDCHFQDKTCTCLVCKRANAVERLVNEVDTFLAQLNTLYTGAGQPDMKKVIRLERAMRAAKKWRHR